MSEKEMDEMVELFISQCREKPDLMKFLMEQIFGKARQNIGLDGGEEDKPIPILLNVFPNHSHKQNSEADQENQSDPRRDGGIKDGLGDSILDSLGSRG